jgi:hypothetical protein
MRRTMAYSRKMWRGVAAEACPPVAAPERRWLTRRLTVAPVFSIQCSVLSSSELKTEHWILNTLGRSGAFQRTENTLRGGHRTTAVGFKTPSKGEALFAVQCRMHDAKWKIGCLVSFQSTESTLKGGHRTTALEFKTPSKGETLFGVHPLGCPVPEPPTGATRPPSPAATALHIWRP